MEYYFVAYGTNNPTVASWISQAAKDSSFGGISYRSWDKNDPSGVPLDMAVEEWISKSSGVVADISVRNHNVTFEIGFAIGCNKKLRLIRNAIIKSDEVSRIGLFDTTGYDEWSDQESLSRILNESKPNENKWRVAKKNSATPFYIVAPHESDLSLFNGAIAQIKKRLYKKFRSFKQWEISRISARELWQNVSQSFGVIAVWSDDDSEQAQIANQRNLLAYGMARGLNIPALLLCKNASALPLDIRDSATEINDTRALIETFKEFRDKAASYEIEYLEDGDLVTNNLTNLNIGDPDAANEQESLSNFFLQTDQFRRVLDGQSNVVVGRKGCGKTAIFLQVRDKIRSNRSNIVVDLNPEGSQLLKLKETMLELKTLGARKEFLEAFWQYVCWLEIAYKLLEKDKSSALRDHILLEKYENLEMEFRKRVDTGDGDFSERLRLLVELVSERMEFKSADATLLKQSSVLEVVHGREISEFRKIVISYLKSKNKVVLLFDNLDRMRSGFGFNEDDGIITVSLIEALKQISRIYRRERIEFQWAVFLRSDVFSFVINDMPDYGKLASSSIEWNDRAMLLRLFELRLINGGKSRIFSNIDEFLVANSVREIGNRPLEDFLVETCLMRPRYMIRLFSLARGRAINLGRNKIEEEDYLSAKKDLAWDVANDISRELQDIIPNSEGLLLDLVNLDGACGKQELDEAIVNIVGSEVPKSRVLEILLWSGAIGVKQNGDLRFIDSFGFQLPVMMTLIKKDEAVEFCIHPTLALIGN